MNDRPARSHQPENAHPPSSDVSGYWRAGGSAAHPRPRSDAVESGRARLVVLAAVFLVAFSAVGCSCSICAYGHRDATQQNDRGAGLRAWRADIIDRNGELLARDLTLYDISVDPGMLTNRAATAKAAGACGTRQLDAKCSPRRVYERARASLHHAQRDSEVRRMRCIRLACRAWIIRRCRAGLSARHLFAHVLGYVEYRQQGHCGHGACARRSAARAKATQARPCSFPSTRRFNMPCATSSIVAWRITAPGGGVGIVMDVAQWRDPIARFLAGFRSQSPAEQE